MSKKLGQIFSVPQRNNVRAYGMKFKILDDENHQYEHDIRHSQNSGLDSGFSTPNMANEELAEGITEVEDKNRSETLIRFTIDNLGDLQDSIFSATSYARNLPWRIMIQPATKQKRIPIQHFLGVFLHCNNKADKQSWACYVHAELRLLKANQSLPPYVKKIQHLFTPKKNYCGFYYFILLDDVLNPLNGFVKDNTITLEVHVIADEPWNKSINSSGSRVMTQNKKAVTYKENELMDKNKAIEELFHISREKLDDGTTSVNVFTMLKDTKSKDIKENSVYKAMMHELKQDSESEDTAGYEDCDNHSQHDLFGINKEEEVVAQKKAKPVKLVPIKCSIENLQLGSKCSFTNKEAKLRMLISEQNFIDRQKEELRIKMNDLDEAKTNNMMTTIGLLEEKIKVLQKETEMEEKKRLNQQAKNYKLERRVKELEKDLEGQHKKFESEKRAWFEKRMQLEEKILKYEKQFNNDHNAELVSYKILGKH